MDLQYVIRWTRKKAIAVVIFSLCWPFIGLFALCLCLFGGFFAILLAFSVLGFAVLLKQEAWAPAVVKPLFGFIAWVLLHMFLKISGFNDQLQNKERSRSDPHHVAGIDEGISFEEEASTVQLEHLEVPDSIEKINEVGAKNFEQKHAEVFRMQFGDHNSRQHGCVNGVCQLREEAFSCDEVAMKILRVNSMNGRLFNYWKAKRDYLRELEALKHVCVSATEEIEEGISFEEEASTLQLEHSEVPDSIEKINEVGAKNLEQKYAEGFRMQFGDPNSKQHGCVNGVCQLRDEVFSCDEVAMKILRVNSMNSRLFNYWNAKRDYLRELEALTHVCVSATEGS